MATGVAVVTFDSDSPESERLLYIGTDNRAAGRAGAGAMLEILARASGGAVPPGALVQVFGGKPGAWNLSERMEGFAETVHGTPIVLAARQYNDENPDRALQVAEATLDAHPDLRGIFCSNAFAGAASALAIKSSIQRGKLPAGQVRVVGFDTTEDILDFIDEGLIDCTLAQNTREMGRLAIEKLAEFAAQHRAAGTFDRPPKGQDIIDTGVTVVWPADVPRFRTERPPGPRPART